MTALLETNAVMLHLLQDLTFREILPEERAAALLREAETTLLSLENVPSRIAAEQVRLLIEIFSNASNTAGV